MLANFIFVGFGGALGAMARFGVSQLFVKGLHLSSFWATMTVNVLGSFLMGILAVYLLEIRGQQAQALFFMTGVLGGFTTFSAFSLDVVQLMEAGRTGMAIFYIAATMGLVILALVLGMGLMRAKIG